MALDLVDAPLTHTEPKLSGVTARTTVSEAGTDRLTASHIGVGRCGGKRVGVGNDHFIQGVLRDGAHVCAGLHESAATTAATHVSKVIIDGEGSLGVRAGGIFARAIAGPKGRRIARVPNLKSAVAEPKE